MHRIHSRACMGCCNWHCRIRAPNNMQHKPTTSANTSPELNNKASNQSKWPKRQWTTLSISKTSTWNKQSGNGTADPGIRVIHTARDSDWFTSLKRTNEILLWVHGMVLVLSVARSLRRTSPVMANQTLWSNQIPSCRHSSWILPLLLVGLRSSSRQTLGLLAAML